LNELLREEQRLATQLALTQESVPTEMVMSLMQLKLKEEHTHIYNATVVEILVILRRIVRRNFAITARRMGIVFKIVVLDPKIDNARLRIDKARDFIYSAIQSNSTNVSTPPTQNQSSATLTLEMVQ
jgi:hypothetical protein